MIPQGFLLLKYVINYTKFLFIKLFIKKLRLKIQNIISILLSIIIINIIILTKAIHILNFDYLNYLNYSILFLTTNSELFNFISLINFKLSKIFQIFTFDGISLYNLITNTVNKITNSSETPIYELSFVFFFIKFDILNLSDMVRMVDYGFNLLEAGSISEEKTKTQISFFLKINKITTNTINLYSLAFFKDGLTFWLLWLVSLVFFVISFGTDKKLYKKNTVFGNFHMYNQLLLLILILMVICFSIKNILIFFISFEMVLIPLFLHIMFQGSRLNKIQAIKYLVMYTLVGSSFLWYTISYFIEIVGSSDFDQLR